MRKVAMVNITTCLLETLLKLNINAVHVFSVQGDRDVIELGLEGEGLPDEFEVKAEGEYAKAYITVHVTPAGTKMEVVKYE